MWNFISERAMKSMSTDVLDALVPIKMKIACFQLRQRPQFLHRSGKGGYQAINQPRKGRVHKWCALKKEILETVQNMMLILKAFNGCESERGAVVSKKQ